MPIREWHGGGPAASPRRSSPSITDDVRNAAYRVILGKGATNYAIGLAGARLVEAILRDEHLVVAGEHGATRATAGSTGVAFSMPSILGARGVEQVLDMRLEPDEERQLEASAEALLTTQARLGL